VVSGAIRETDVVGWHKQGVTIGVIFTAVNTNGEDPVTKVFYSKIVGALREIPDRKLASSVAVTFHVFPENFDKGGGDSVADPRLYPDILRLAPDKKFSGVLKRGIDILASGTLLLLLWPVLAVIALAIKLSSEGPIIFAQERLGQFGKRFKFLKFRSMHVNSNSQIHRDYVQRLIGSGSDDKLRDPKEPKVYKITDDPRVTPVGKFLRRTSLDELPQLWNVLRGEMSLVGPRPPIPYEFEIYASWHRRRVLEVKPGVTGLWQVSGRSSVTFNDMVRLDLRYVQTWSLWLDLKILLATPRAVLNGKGAF
jgi:exopolysaccharide biosynthesis polyprenyl glycosylphosphotransferase